MITPAFLLLASASLIGTALARLGRTVDRTRALKAAIATRSGPLEPPDRLRQTIVLLRTRSLYSERAITAFFSATTLFVADSLAIVVDRYFGGALSWLPITLAIAGVVLVLLGAIAMMTECTMSARQIRAEADHALDLIQ